MGKKKGGGGREKKKVWPPPHRFQFSHGVSLAIMHVIGPGNSPAQPTHVGAGKAGAGLHYCLPKEGLIPQQPAGTAKVLRKRRGLTGQLPALLVPGNQGQAGVTSRFLLILPAQASFSTLVPDCLLLLGAAFFCGVRGRCGAYVLLSLFPCIYTLLLPLGSVPQIQTSLFG